MTDSSTSSLHTKTFAVDGARVFAGSFNFDPRSNQLNTELGFVIDSPKLAQTMADVFATGIPLRAYRVRSGPVVTLEWSEIVDGKEKIYLKEPHAPWWPRTPVVLLSWLPIEGLF